MTHTQLAAATIIVLAGVYLICGLITGQIREGRRSALGRYLWLRHNTHYTRREAWRIARRPALPPWRSQ